MVVYAFGVKMRCSFSFLSCFTGILLLVTEVRSQVAFVQPPPAGPLHNYQDNPAYGYGSTITVHWTGDIPKGVNSLRLETRRDLIDPQPADAKYTLETENLSTSISTVTYVVNMAVWQFSEYGKMPLYLVCLDAESLDVLGESHYYNITNGPASTTKSSTSISTLGETSTTTSTINASNTGSTMDGTPPYSTNPATSTASTASTASTTAAPQSAQKLPKKAIAGISVGATIGGILLIMALGFLGRKYRIWNNGIFHNFSRGGGKTANIAELQAVDPLELPANNPTELPVNQEIKNARVWTHPRGSGGLYEVP